jgi:ABC-type microcin C transport system duplicated ATPase subunit YejF
MTDTVLDIRDLNVRFDGEDGEIHAVKGVSLSVAKGETLAVVGESGSGKSQTMMAVMGLLAANGRVTGSARYRGMELIGQPIKTLNIVRGVEMTMIFQEPMTSLDPLYTIGDQIAEPIRYHRKVSKAEARARALELLNLVRIPDAERRLDSYPHEMSGGQRQRVMIAMALANDPELLIADEPTTALDVTIQAQILDLLKELKDRLGLAIVFISHDLGVVRRFADRVAVMRRGEVVETGGAEAIFADPQHDYTKMLLAAEPTGRKDPPLADAPILIDARNMSIRFKYGGDFLGRGVKYLVAVDKVSLMLKEGQTIGVVGESGSGKSTLGRILLRLYDGEGRVVFCGKDISKADKAAMRPLRRELQLVFQDPYGSLSPRMTAGEIITEGLLIHEPHLSKAERDRRAIESLIEVGLDPKSRNRYPHEFSGGQRQRLAIARAIILKPKVIVLDEPTSALDRSVQKQIIELLRDLQAKHKLAYLFISHDLAVVRALSDYIMVMKNGRVVEQGLTDEIFDQPSMDYTKELMAAAMGG